LSTVASTVPPAVLAAHSNLHPSAYLPQHPCVAHPNAQLLLSHEVSFMARAVRCSPVAASQNSKSPTSSVERMLLESLEKSRWVTRPLWPLHLPVEAQSPALYK